MKNEENESSATKASDPLTPKQDNRIFESIPVRPAPWHSPQGEISEEKYRERQIDAWLDDPLRGTNKC